jgi:hypothetical protein
MSRPTEPNALGGLSFDDERLAELGYVRCEHCGAVRPSRVSRCRRRRCPGYAQTWARDTMRRIRENLHAYGGLACMLSLTAPGVEAGLVWDHGKCTHGPGVKCSGPLGCRVVAGAAEFWNEDSRKQWRTLNRVCKKRADAAIARLGADAKFGLLLYEWELQSRGVWHLHFVVGMETGIERAWAFEYVKAMREVGARYGYGFVDEKPLHSPQPAEQAARYVSKYLAKWREDGELEVSETVLSAGRSLLTYISLKLTAQSGCTMRSLRNARLVWAWREGHLERAHGLTAVEFFVALCLVESAVPARAP